MNALMAFTMVVAIVSGVLGYVPLPLLFIRKREVLGEIGEYGGRNHEPITCYLTTDDWEYPLVPGHEEDLTLRKRRVWAVGWKPFNGMVYKTRPVS